MNCDAAGHKNATTNRCHRGELLCLAAFAASSSASTVLGFDIFSDTQMPRWFDPPWYLSPHGRAPRSIFPRRRRRLPAFCEQPIVLVQSRNELSQIIDSTRVDDDVVRSL